MSTKKMSSATMVTINQKAQKTPDNIIADTNNDNTKQSNQNTTDVTTGDVKTNSVKINNDIPEDAIKNDVNFPIIGIGASAGGLEAFEQFFSHVPADCDMAFVLIQHLDPSHTSILSEILQRSTRLPVYEATDQMPVLPNNIYVIPPNREMAIFNGKLQLNTPAEPRGQRLPIDTFLRSLADERGESGIGIVLSGTGTDGTLGLRAILGAGGISIVQSPETAKFNGMPYSAIHAGYATHILPATEMAAALMGDLHDLIVRQDGASRSWVPFVFLLDKGTRDTGNAANMNCLLLLGM